MSGRVAIGNLALMQKATHPAWTKSSAYLHRPDDLTQNLEMMKGVVRGKEFLFEWRQHTGSRCSRIQVGGATKWSGTAPDEGGRHSAEP